MHRQVVLATMDDEVRSSLMEFELKMEILKAELASLKEQVQQQQVIPSHQDASPPPAKKAKLTSTCMRSVFSQACDVRALVL